MSLFPPLPCRYLHLLHNFTAAYLTPCLRALHLLTLASANYPYTRDFSTLPTLLGYTVYHDLHDSRIWRPLVICPYSISIVAYTT